MTRDHDPHQESSDSPLEAVLEAYLDELAEGRNPDQESFIRRYPDIADELKGVFRTLEFVEATGRSLDGSRLEKGCLLGDYRIIRETARGGMGVVYEAIQISLGRRVALKVLPAGALLSDTAAERFSREAATAGRLQHTNIVPVYGVGREQGIYYYAMQYIEGQSLSGFLRTLREERTTVGKDWHQRVAHWGQQIADALEYAHTEGIIHRDIKPSNLLLDARDNVWVTDFGLARTDALASLTLTGDVIGTARYMSPEQARGGRRQIDRRTDIYSLGVTVYELLTLKPAYDGESREDVLNQVVFSDPPSMKELDATIPRDLVTIIGKCMSRNPADRYSTAGDVAEDFRRFLASESILARRTPLWIRFGRYCRKNRLRVATSFGMILLVTISVLLFLRMRHERGYTCLEQARGHILHDWKPDEARRLLDEASRLGIRTADLEFNKGLLVLFSGNPQGAIPLLELALIVKPDSVEIEYAIASAYLATGDLVNGRRHFNRVRDREVDTALAWLLRGQVLNVLEQDGVLESYNNAVKMRPNFSRAIAAMAQYRSMRLVIEGDRTQLEPMLDDYDACVVFQKNNGGVWADRAMGRLSAIAYAGSQSELAEYPSLWMVDCRNDFEEANRLTQNRSRPVLVRLGVFERYCGQFRKSAETFLKAAQIGESETGSLNAAIMHHRCISLHAAGDVEQAFQEILPVCEASPRTIPLQLHKALLLISLKREKEARELIHQVLKYCQSDQTSIILATSILASLGDRERAQETLTRFIEEKKIKNNQHPPMAFLAGQMNSEQLLDWAGQHPGHSCESWFVIAMDQLGQGKPDEAQQALRQCLRTGVYIYIQFRYAQALTGWGGSPEPE